MISKKFSFLIPALFIISCGGGGGGGSSAAPVIPLASISFSTSFGSEVDVGTNFSFSWSTTNASSCNASGDWSGSVATSGSHQKNLQSAGQYSFTLSCSNSEGTQTSKTLSVVANYVIISGTIFDSDNSNKTVYIDENRNKVRDSFEPSGTSDSSGFYEIRYLQDEQCLKKFPIRVEGSNLNSFNPPGFDEVNISQATSLFEELFNNFEKDRYSNSILCDTFDTGIKESLNDYFVFMMEDVTNSEGFLYDEIQSDPQTSSRNSISTERFNDIKAFNSSLSSITSSILEAIKNLIDSQGEGYDRSDFSFDTRAELDETNLRIFLNDITYPNPTTDQSPIATSIDDVSVQANIKIKIDNISTIPNYDINGWDEKAFITLPDVLISNNNQVISDTSSCWINFTNLCIQEPNYDYINYSNADVFQLIEMTKSTSRGIEMFAWDERFDASSNNCNIFYDSLIFEDIGTDTRRWTSYTNNYFDAAHSDFGDGTPNYCYTYSGAQYKAMVHTNIFSDGTYSQFTWDSNQIDFLPDIVEMGWYDDEDPPPNTISQDIVNIMAERPNLYDLYPEWDLNSDENLDILINWIIPIMVNDLNSSELFYLSWWIENTKGGIVNFRMTNENGYPYSICSLNYDTIYESTNFGYDIQSAFDAFYLCAITTDEEGASVMSRASTHTELNDTVCSPYSGCYQVSIVAAERQIDEKISDEKPSLSGTGNNMIRKISNEFHERESWSHLSDSN